MLCVSTHLRMASERAKKSVMKQPSVVSPANLRGSRRRTTPLGWEGMTTPPSCARVRRAAASATAGQSLVPLKIFHAWSTVAVSTFRVSPGER